MSSRSPLPSVSTKTEPRSYEGMGNGLFATSDIKVGEDVMHAKVPFVAVLDTSRLEDTCSGCFGKRQMENSAELKACTGCRVVKYCDRVSSRSVMLCLFRLFFLVQALIPVVGLVSSVIDCLYLSLIFLWENF